MRRIILAIEGISIAYSSACGVVFRELSLSGTLDLISIPVAMILVGIGENAFAELIDFERLQGKMVDVRVHVDQLRIYCWPDG